MESRLSVLCLYKPINELLKFIDRFLISLVLFIKISRSNAEKASKSCPPDKRGLLCFAKVISKPD